MFGVLISALNLAVSVYFRPWGYSTLAANLFQIASSRSTAGLTQGVFNDLGNLTIYSEKIDYETGELRRILIDDRRSESDRQIIAASNGSIFSDPKTRTIMLLLRDGTIHSNPEC